MESITADKIHLAGLHFKHKNYPKALLLYNEIEATLSAHSPNELVKIRRFYNLTATPVVGPLCHPKLAQVLDHRAATLDKLGQWEKALEDARRITSVDPLDCRGYLRLGKLYTKRNQLVDAYKAVQKGCIVIERAVSKYEISVSQSLFQLLKDQYAKLNRILKEQRTPPLQAPSMSAKGLQRRLEDMVPLKRTAETDKLPKRVKYPSDPLIRLPKEVIETVFLHVPVRALLRCLLVCRHWNETLTLLPRLFRGAFQLKHRVSAPEYLAGLRLMKRVALSMLVPAVYGVKLWLTLNSAHLARILHSILGDATLHLRQLELLNSDLSCQLLLNQLHRLRWPLPNLQTISRLRLGVNASLSHPNVLLSLFPNLEALDVVVVDCQLNKSHNHMLPPASELSNLKTPENHPLILLCLINHPKLNREQRIRPSPLTYDPAPPFMDCHLANLRKISIVLYDFLNLEADFGRFLSRTNGLTEVYMENNENMLLKTFLAVLRLYEPQLRLEKLTFREQSPDRAYSLSEIDPDMFPQLHGLCNLDLYLSSLSGRGLVKFLQMANRHWNLVRLNIGDCKFVGFRKDKLVAGHSVTEFGDIFQAAPRLETLLLPDLDLDDLSMKCLHRDITRVCGHEPLLRLLDLSFCYEVSGIGLMNLLNFSSSGTAQNLFLQNLIIDGLDVSKDSVDLLLKRKIVENVQWDAQKTRWRQYGVNSLMQG